MRNAREPWSKTFQFGAVKMSNCMVKLQIFLMFIPKIGEDEPILTSIFFKWVDSTTNQLYFFMGFWTSQVDQGCGTMVPAGWIRRRESLTQGAPEPKASPREESQHGMVPALGPWGHWGKRLLL